MKATIRMTFFSLPLIATTFLFLFLSLTSAFSLPTLDLLHPHQQQKRSPKVFGLDFTKHNVAGTQGAGSLHKRHSKRQAKAFSADLSNIQIAYIINITIGTPPQPFSVQLDTGSADLWVASSDAEACQQTDDNPDGCSLPGEFRGEQSKTAKLVDQGGFEIQYQDGSAVQGDYINDTVAIGDMQIKSQQLGIALQTTRILGIMGIGYSADESVSRGDPGAIYPNIIQSMQDQDLIGALAYSLWLNDPDSANGSILFGGVDTAKYTPPLTALPIQKGANGTYTDFTVALSSLTFTDASSHQALAKNDINLPVILDCGTTDTYLPDNIANDILTGVGAINSDELGLVVPCSYASSKAFFTFNFGGDGGPAIKVPMAEFVTPLLTLDGSTPRFPHGGGAACSFGLMSSGPLSANTPILLGDSFLRSAYVVYDLANNQIAMAQTKFNASDSDVQEIASGGKIPGVTATATGVAVTQSYTGLPLQTNAASKGAAGASVTGAAGSPTFDLGVGKATGTGGKKSAAGGALEVPARGIMGVVCAAVVGMGVLVGGGLLAVR